MAAVIPVVHGTTWSYWVARRAFQPHLAATILVFLATPIGSSDAERSFRKIKKTGLHKERAGKMTSDNKSKINFIYVNAGLQLTNMKAKQVGPREPDIQPAVPVLVAAGPVQPANPV